MRYMYRKSKDQQYTRHPLLYFADIFCSGLLQMDFSLLDHGESMEVICCGRVEPEELWSGNVDLYLHKEDTILFKEGKTKLRRSLLTEHFRKGTLPESRNVIVFGRIFYRNSDYFETRHVLEGIIHKKSISEIFNLWNRTIQIMFGISARVYFRKTDATVYEIVFRRQNLEEEIIAGIIGTASALAKEMAQIPEDEQLWLFRLDIDHIAKECLDLSCERELYQMDLTYLESIHSTVPAAGSSLASIITDKMRQLGYRELVTSPFYPEDAYQKMNMFKDKWDINNQPYIPDMPLPAEQKGLRTVHTAAIEEALAYNCRLGRKYGAVFEVSHIYRPVKGELCPKEHIALGFGVYGAEENEDTIKDDISKLLQELGVRGMSYVKTERAIAYEPDEAFLILNEKFCFLKGTFGRIHPQASVNYGIEYPAYVGQMELTALSNECGIELPYKLEEDADEW